MLFSALLHNGLEQQVSNVRSLFHWISLSVFLQPSLVCFYFDISLLFSLWLSFQSLLQFLILPLFPSSLRFFPSSLLALGFCQFAMRSQNLSCIAHILLFASVVAQQINTSISAAKFCFLVPSMCSAKTDWLYLENKSPLRQMRANPTNCFIYLVALELT